MKEDKVTFIKTDQNKIINEKCIRWVKKMDDCLDICTKSDGCGISPEETHRLCKINNPNSYEKLNKLFIE